MKVKFTPGPWEAQPVEEGRDHVRIRGRVLGMRWKIANVHRLSFTGQGSIERNAREEIESIANARLIAAAPTVFETLVAARVIIAEDRATLFAGHMNFETGEVDDELGKAGIAAYDLVLSQIDAAIALATGEAS